MNTESNNNTIPGWFILVVVSLTALLTAGLMRYYFWPGPFSPTELSSKEERLLEEKIQRVIPDFHLSAENVSAEKLEPSPYSEKGADRTLKFSERELNALLAKNTEFADRLAVDLADDLLSATLLVPVDPDFPILGGKTVRVKSGMTLAFDNDRLVAKLRGVSVMGVPLPNDWLGGLKNVDLVQQFGDQGGFWSAFSAGIAQLSVRDGSIQIELAE